MRAALQFLMRHMVKRAVMRSPIKRALALADLERAQAMIYKLVVNGLMEEPSGGKSKPGEFLGAPSPPSCSAIKKTAHSGQIIRKTGTFKKKAELWALFVFLCVRSED